MRQTDVKRRRGRMGMSSLGETDGGVVAKGESGPGGGCGVERAARRARTATVEEEGQAGAAAQER